MDDLQLHTVRVVEKERVVAGQVRVLLGIALDVDGLRAHPLRSFLHLCARLRFERDVVEPDRVAVVRFRLGLSLTQPERDIRAGQLPDCLAALTLDLADPVVPERAEQALVER